MSNVTDTPRPSAPPLKVKGSTAPTLKAKKIRLATRDPRRRSR